MDNTFGLVWDKFVSIVSPTHTHTHTHTDSFGLALLSLCSTIMLLTGGWIESEKSKLLHPNFGH